MILDARPFPVGAQVVFVEHDFRIATRFPRTGRCPINVQAEEWIRGRDCQPAIESKRITAIEPLPRSPVRIPDGAGSVRSEHWNVDILFPLAHQRESLTRPNVPCERRIGPAEPTTTPAERDRSVVSTGSGHPDLWRKAPRLSLHELPCERRTGPAERHHAPIPSVPGEMVQRMPVCVNMRDRPLLPVSANPLR